MVMDEDLTWGVNTQYGVQVVCCGIVCLKPI